MSSDLWFFLKIFCVIEFDDHPNKKPLLDFSHWKSPVALNYHSTMSDVTFLDTMSIGQFKNEVAAETIKLVRSPKSGLYFIADEAGKSVATVSKKILKSEDLTDPVVSHVQGNDGKEFYVMHNAGSGDKNTERSW
mgnify:FL=1